MYVYFGDSVSATMTSQLHSNAVRMYTITIQFYKFVITMSYAYCNFRTRISFADYNLV